MGSLAMTIFKVLMLLSCLIELEAWESFSLVPNKPVVTYLDLSVIAFINFTMTRYGRRSEVYYSDVHMELSKPLDNNYTIHVVFYEAVNNEYKRSLIQMRYKFCNYIFKDNFLGASVRKKFQLESCACPMPKGAYHFYNMTASADHLPPMHFRKARFYVELNYKKKNVFKAYTDLELKRKKKN